MQKRNNKELFRIILSPGTFFISFLSIQSIIEHLLIPRVNIIVPTCFVNVPKAHTPISGDHKKRSYVLFYSTVVFFNRFSLGRCGFFREGQGDTGQTTVIDHRRCLVSLPGQVSSSWKLDPGHQVRTTKRPDTKDKRFRFNLLRFYCGRMHYYSVVQCYFIFRWFYFGFDRELRMGYSRVFA